MKRQQSQGQFEEGSDQFLTYSFSNHISATVCNPKKNIYKELTPKINIIKCQRTIQDRDFLEHNKNRKHIQSNVGKIIKIGDAVFKSNFQSGNLGNVEQKASNTYKITLENQINSNRKSAWFYFRCEGLKGQVNFIISGFTKSSSLYNEGMKICYKQIKEGQKWRRGGNKITYTSNYQSQTENYVYQLNFTYTFRTTEVYPVQFAYCFPYTFARVYTLIKHLLTQKKINYSSLGKSYDGREIPLLTIGNQESQRSIVLSARVHPGQTVSSFIMEGFLKQLLSDSDYARSLRKKYLFKIVPMINPDGVVRGNYRLSAAGYDLNRKWKYTYQSSHPQIFHLKNMIKQLNKQKKVQMYIDIHGHSRKKNAFFYGCSTTQNDEEMQKPKQFPYLMQKLNSNYKYEYCTFAVQKDKEGTARIAMWKQLKINYVYTLQSTFCGAANGGNFLESDYQKLGKSLLQGIAVYFYQKNQDQKVDQTSDSSKKQPSALQKFINFREEIKNQLKQNPYLLNIGMKDDSGSDSQPQAGIIPECQRQIKSVNLAPLNIDQKQKIKAVSPNSLNSSKNLIRTSIKTSQNQKRNRITPEQLKDIISAKMQKIEEQSKQFEIQRPVKRLPTKAATNFNIQQNQLGSLTTTALMQKRQRVHSRTGNRISFIKNKNRIASENELDNENEEDLQKQRVEQMNRNLLHTRQGAQYRRVRKIAQQSKRKSKTFIAQDPIPIVRGIITVNNYQLNKSKLKQIAPSFYPQSQQKNRKHSVEISVRNKHKIVTQLSNRKLYINGDEVSVRCRGIKIGF